MVACVVVYAVSYHPLRDHYSMLIDPAVVKPKARHWKNWIKSSVCLHMFMLLMGSVRFLISLGDMF